MNNHFRTTLIASAAATLIFAFSACGTEVATAPARSTSAARTAAPSAAVDAAGSPDALERQLAAAEQ